MTFGPASAGFLTSPGKLGTTEFFAVAFLIVALSLYWGRFINSQG